MHQKPDQNIYMYYVTSVNFIIPIWSLKWIQSLWMLIMFILHLSFNWLKKKKLTINFFVYVQHKQKKWIVNFFLLLVLKIHECSQLEKGKGLIIPCLVDNIENVTGNCHTYLEKMARIVFSDYRLIYHFVDQCSVDIEQLKCGRIGPADENVSQVETLVWNF